jgi:hypothetical protein
MDLFSLITFKAHTVFDQANGVRTKIQLEKSKTKSPQYYSNKKLSFHF